MRDTRKDLLLRLCGTVVALSCAITLAVPEAVARKEKRTPHVDQMSDEAKEPSKSFLEPAQPSSKSFLELPPSEEPKATEKEPAAAPPAAEPAATVPSEPIPQDDAGTPSVMKPLQGKTEVTEIILDEMPLYKQAVKAIDEGDYREGVLCLQELNAQLGEEGHEPYHAECMYLEAGCHQMLKRQNAAMDMYKKAFDLFAKYDSQNPLKGKALQGYTDLQRLKLQGGVDQNTLQGSVDQQRVALLPQRAQFAKFAIDPNAVLEVKDSNRDVLLEVNDRTVLPRIVKECFSEMSCLETAEIGSNVTNAEERWSPLMVHGKSAAFAMNGSGHPTFRANVNGRSYMFDVILPELAPGLRKVLLVTNREKICAVDVDSFDTWLLRMQRAKDGRVTTARWYKLTHKKDRVPFVSPVAKPTQVKHPGAIRSW